MPRPTIEEIRQIQDFATMYRWNLVFATLPVVGFAGIVASPGLNVRCESVELPKATGQKITTNIRGHQVHQPGIYNYSGSITVTFNETIDNMVSEFIKAWHEACWAPKTGTQLPKSEVESTIIMSRLDSQDNTIWSYKLTGCFLDDFDLGGTLDGAASETLKPSATFSYDYYQMAASFGI